MPMNKARKPPTRRGCSGGPRVGRARRGRRHEPLARRLLHAEGRDGQDHPGLAADAGRQGRVVHAVLRRVGRPGSRGRAGLKADVVFLSTGDDVNLLVDAGLVDSNWNHQAYNGIAADTVVVFAVRNGNPKHIKGWNDLISPASRWSRPTRSAPARRSGTSSPPTAPSAASARPTSRRPRTCSSSSSTSSRRTPPGRNATNTFLAGKGDVLITYESEAINARLNGQDIQYVIPRQTMLIELPIAVLKASSNKDAANKFIRFVKSAAAQELFAQYGFRPVNPRSPRSTRRSSRRGRASSRSTTRSSAAGATPTRGGSTRTRAGWSKIEQAVGGPTTG